MYPFTSSTLLLLHFHFFYAIPPFPLPQFGCCATIALHMGGWLTVPREDKGLARTGPSIQPQTHLAHISSNSTGINCVKHVDKTLFTVRKSKIKWWIAPILHIPLYGFGERRQWVRMSLWTWIPEPCVCVPTSPLRKVMWGQGWVGIKVLFCCRGELDWHLVATADWHETETKRNVYIFYLPFEKLQLIEIWCMIHYVLFPQMICAWLTFGRLFFKIIVQTCFFP